jgi:NAD-dependent SIR2 family protein deacetylase
VLLIAAGAGFSADCGLPVYDSIAEDPLYAAAGVTYGDLCNPLMMVERPELFFGFWGTCCNMYRAAPLHTGYTLLNRWAEDAQRRMQTGAQVQPCWVYTSNVDGNARHSPHAHVTPVAPHRDFPSGLFRRCGALADVLTEIHGCCSEWLCSGASGYCFGQHADGDDALPMDINLQTLGQWQHEAWRRWNDSVDKQKAQRCASAWWKLLASPAASAVMLQPAEHSFAVDAGSKCVSLPDRSPLEAQESASASNYPAAALTWTSSCSVPLCSLCQRIARPSVVMFGDSDALVLALAQRRRQRYQDWEAAVEREVSARLGAYRVLVLELGCGTRVRSISDEAQCVHDDINAISARFGADPAATLVRINPSADSPSSVIGSVVCIQGGAEEVSSRHSCGVLPHKRASVGVVR